MNKTFILLQYNILSIFIFQFKIKFIASDEHINEKIIGHLKRDTDFNYDDIKEMIESNDYETINLDNAPYSICSLSNDTLLCTFTNKGATIYDKEFKPIKTLNRINGKSVNYWTPSTNYQDRVYLADIENNEIVMCDLNLQVIKTITGGADEKRFNDPRITYYDNHVYVAEHVNQRVQKLTDELIFVKLYPLSFSPRFIQINNDIALLASYYPSQIYCFSIEDFQVRHVYSGHNGHLSVINSYFYEYYHSTKKFYCYDQNGILIDEIQTDAFQGTLRDCYDGCLQVFNRSLICSAFGAKKILQIKNPIK